MAISKAERINLRNGGPLIAPWELEDVPEEWIDAYEVILTAGAGAARKRANERRFSAFRQKHPTYRKYT